jgi:acid-sensing ion channel, other
MFFFQYDESSRVVSKRHVSLWINNFYLHKYTLFHLFIQKICRIHEDFDTFKHRDDAENWTLSEGYKSENPNSYPWPIISHVNNGLRFILQLKDYDMDFVCRGPNQGFKVYWTMPGEIPNSMSKSIFIPIEQDVTILMRPLMTVAAKKLLKYEPELRQCFLKDERSLKYFKIYTKSNCVFECVSNFTLKLCGCVKFSMPRDDGTKICNATKLTCILEAENKYLSRDEENADSDDTQCDCLPACTEISYEAEIRQTNFDYERMFKSFAYDLSDNQG